MAKPASWQIDPASYGFSGSVQTRFGDLDPLGHLNNVAYAALFEQGRVMFNRTIDERHFRVPGVRWLVAAVAIDYLAEGHFPEHVEIASGVSRIGTANWDIASAAFQGGKCIAVCTTTLVQTGEDGAVAVDAALRAALEVRGVVRG
jgi:acyl-CoA thioester hydrolase